MRWTSIDRIMVGASVGRKPGTNSTTVLGDTRLTLMHHEGFARKAEQDARLHFTEEILPHTRSLCPHGK